MGDTAVKMSNSMYFCEMWKLLRGKPASGQRTALPYCPDRRLSQPDAA